MKKSELIIIIAVVALITIGMFARYALYDGKITHDFPMTINAGDPNSRLSEASHVLQSGSAKYIPPWFSGESDLLMLEPPLHLIIAALTAGGSGLEIFDILYFDAILAGLGAALLFFVLFSRVFKNKMLGLLAAALLIFPLEQFFHYQIRIGMYATFSTILYIPLIILFTYELIKKPVWTNAILLIITLTAQFYMHASEAIVSGVLVGAYLLIFERKNIGWKKLIVIGAVIFLLCAAYLPPLFFNYLQGHQGATFIQTGELAPGGGEPQIFMSNLLHPALYALAILALLFTWKKKEYRLLNFMFIAYFIIIFVLAKFGIGTYYVSIRGRPIFYIIAYPLVAIGLYMLASTVSRFVPVRKHLFLGGIVILAILGQAYAANSVQPIAGTLYTQDIYDGFLWLRENTPEDTRILCFGCNQLESSSTFRLTAQAAYWEQDGFQHLIEVANKNRTTLRMGISGYTDERLYRSGFFQYKKRGALGDKNRELCSFDYFTFRPALQQTVPIFNQIAQNLVEKNSTVVYNKPSMVIIKNAQVNRTCI